MVAYESCLLKDSKLLLGIYEKELLLVIHALTIWKHYLLGADFTVKTNHQSLKYFLMQTKLSRKHMKWANFLSIFHFQMVYNPGATNRVADALSIRPQVDHVSMAYHQDLESMRETYIHDPNFGKIMEEI